MGGSASTDGCTGMLAALGAVFRNEAGHQLDAGGGHLQQIHSTDTTALVDLSHIEIVVASDVQNPLAGPDGAVAVYGPQKSAEPEQVQMLDTGLAHLVHRLTVHGISTRRSWPPHPAPERPADWASPACSSAGEWYPAPR